MIYVRDKGQMCNNMLQFAHVWAFAREHGRKALSMRFAYKYRYFALCRWPRHNFLRYSMAKFAASRGWMPVVSYDVPGEKSAEKERTILTAKTVMVQGWEVRFYELFLKYLDEIREMFAFSEKIEGKISGLLSSAEGRKKVGLHVRRGDYARWNGGRYFFSDAQYAAVLASYAKVHPREKLTVFVCSNDPMLDESIYRQAMPEADFVFAKGNPGEDLCLLSHCDALIGAPSTFSLVASMYRELPLYWIEDPEKRVEEADFQSFLTLFRQIK